MLGTIGFILMALGGLNLAWFLLWLIISLIGRGSIALSRKIGTDNEHTDKPEGISKGLGASSIRRAVISGVVLAVGVVLFLISGERL